VLAERHLKAGAGHYGLLIGAIGVGAGLGPLVVQRLVEEVRTCCEAASISPSQPRRASALPWAH
jgi:hypothetical protein